MYAPLRIHSHHSLLTGVGSPQGWLERAATWELPAMALCDVHSLGGMVEFLQAARSSSVRPILGAEFDDAPRHPGRVVALVQTEEGYRNLCKLISARRIGYDPGTQHGTPEAEQPFDLVHALVRWQAGLVFLVDHPEWLLKLFGRVPPRQVLAALSPACLAGDRTQADETLRALDPNKTPDPLRLARAQDLIEAAQATGAAVLAVPDAYYPRVRDRAVHRLQIAVKHNALLADLPAAWLAREPAHLPSPTELLGHYADLPDVPGAWPVDSSTGASNHPFLARTLDVAASCNYVPPLGGVVFPNIELEAGETPYSRLCQLAFDGARQRYRPMGPEVLQRLQYELSTLQNLGFAPYFLLVHGIAEFAREQGIPHVGRGSAADSLVAYCLRLTDADPFRYRLPFERFLNPARKDRPDVDLDFCWRRRDEVLEHVFTLFGAQRTAMISTLGRFGARSAFREAALVHGIPPAEFERWSRRIPMFGGGEAGNFDGTAGSEATADRIDEALQENTLEAPADHDPVASHGPHSHDPLAANPLAQALRSLPETRDFPFDDPRFAAALEDAAALLDTPRHFGLHPGGVVVAPQAITDYLPCCPSAKGPVVTQLDKDGVEALGLVKMDLLGNRALTTLHDALELLEQRGVTVDLETLAEDDGPTAEALRHGRTLGCFQIESPGMRHLLQQTGACTMDDVIQAVALIRPGPAQAGMKEAYVRRFRQLEDPTPPHPCLTEVLRETYGVMLYQEDVMQVAATAAGMDLATADGLRRALQKRRMDELPGLHASFTQGCLDNGLSPAEADHIWQRIEGFASFAFCKAHAVTYGRIAYRAAWLKTHHPVEFLAAFLNSDTGYYATRVYVEEVRRLGAPILGPDINRSGREFCVQRAPDGRVALRLGLNQVYGLSERTLDQILEQRAVQPFLSLPDFLERSGSQSDEARHLIRCGALDAFDRTRPELLWRLHLLRRAPTRAPREARLDAGQLGACQAGTDPLFQSPSAGWGGQGLGLNATRLPAGTQVPLFAAPPDRTPVLPGLPDWSPRERGVHEQELLGVSLVAHPTRLFVCPGEARMQAAVRSPADRRAPMPPRACADVPRLVGARITLRAWLAASRRVRTKDGSWMRFLTLEDESGLAEAILFPDVYRRTGDRLRSDETLLVSGVVEDQLGACLLRTEQIW